MGRKPKYTKETKIKEYIEGRKSFIDWIKFSAE